jgi:hypothetical protein
MTKTQTKAQLLAKYHEAEQRDIESDAVYTDALRDTDRLRIQSDNAHEAHHAAHLDLCHFEENEALDEHIREQEEAYLRTQEGK